MKASIWHAFVLFAVAAGLTAATGCTSAVVRLSYQDGADLSYLMSDSSRPLRVKVDEILCNGNLGARPDGYWATRVRSEIDAALQREARRTGRRIETIGTWHDADAVLDQADRRRLGLVESLPAGPEPQLADWDLLVRGTLRVTVEESVEADQRFAWRPVFSYNPLDHITIEEVAVPVRVTTVSCTLHLLDRRGRTIDTYNSEVEPFITRAEKASFGLPMERAERLTPQDDDLQRAIGQIAPAFAARFFPRANQVDVAIESSTSELSKQAVALARAAAPGDRVANENALQAFEAACNADPDDHRSRFGAGVMLERLGRLDEALDAYEHAIALDNDSYDLSSTRDRRKQANDPYFQARQRVARRIEDRQLAAGAAR